MTYSLKDLLAELEQVFVAENKVGILVIDTDTLKDFLTDRITKLVTEAMEITEPKEVSGTSRELEEKVGWEDAKTEMNKDLETEGMIIGRNLHSVYHICPKHGTSCNMPLSNDCVDCKLYLSGADVRTLIKDEKRALLRELSDWNNDWRTNKGTFKEKLDQLEAIEYVKSLPEFDAVMFKRITGIDTESVSSCDHSKDYNYFPHCGKKI